MNDCFNQIIWRNAEASFWGARNTCSTERTPFLAGKRTFFSDENTGSTGKTTFFVDGETVSTDGTTFSSDKTYRLIFLDIILIQYFMN
jgi:hypothetical protein